MREFLYEVSAELDKEFCTHVVSKFEKDPDQYQGFIGFRKLVNLDIKQSIDLKITHKDHWIEENNIFYKSFKSSLGKYSEKICKLQEDAVLLSGDFFDKGYQIQKTIPGGFYTWHNDFAIDPDGYRVLTVIWYLNDVIEDGYTEFIDGTRIQPECGKILIFPSTWTYVHRGYPPKSENKYICTGWLYCGL